MLKSIKLIFTILVISSAVTLLGNGVFADLSDELDGVISNVSSDKFTVSWATATPENGRIKYGTTPALGNTAHDVRGELFEGATHYIELTELDGNTTYYFDVISGGVLYDNGGAHYTAMTGPVKSPASESDVAYGQVFLSDGTTLAEGAIAYINLRDNDGLGTAGDSQTCSSLIGGEGYRYLELNNVRNQALSSFFEYSESGDSVVIKVKAPNGETGSQITDTSEDTPAPPLTLHLNSAPVLDPIGEKSVNEEALLQFTVTASDPDEDPLVFSATGLPLGAEFDPNTQIFTWLPGYDQAGVYEVTFTVKDTGELTDCETIAITVNNDNRPPIIIPIGDKKMYVGWNLYIVVKATNPDTEEDPARMVYSVTTPLPPNTKFNPATHALNMFTRIPGDYTVTFKVDDGYGASATETITITVSDGPYVSYMTPVRGRAGNRAQIGGSNFKAKDAYSKVRFTGAGGAADAVISYWYNNYIFFRVPQLPRGIYNVTVITQGGESAVKTFEIL